MKNSLILLFSFIAFTAAANSPSLEYACMTEDMRMIQVLKLESKHILNLGYGQALSATKEELEDGSVSYSYDLRELQKTPKVKRTGTLLITAEDSGDFIFSLKGSQTELDDDGEQSASIKCQKHQS